MMTIEQPRSTTSELDGIAENAALKRSCHRVAFLALLLLAQIDQDNGALAATLTFDDLTPLNTFNPGFVPDGYGGLDWERTLYLNAPLTAPSGYANGIVSGDYVAGSSINGYPVITGPLFTFTGAYFTAAWRDGLDITAKGFNGDTEIYSKAFAVNHDGPMPVGFGWTGIDKLTFVSSGGVFVPGLNGAGDNFAMDNFTYNFIPEPTTVALFGLGALTLSILRRRR